MSTTTSNYGLYKPELTDPADITAMNKNWDQIDEELQKQATKITFGTTELTEGSSPLETGKIYLVYE